MKKTIEPPLLSFRKRSCAILYRLISQLILMRYISEEKKIVLKANNQRNIGAPTTFERDMKYWTRNAINPQFIKRAPSQDKFFMVIMTPKIELINAIAIPTLIKGNSV